MTTSMKTTRRGLLQGAAASSALLAAPSILSAAAHTKWVRVSMTSDEGVAHLETYRKAVATMWTLEPSNPHNWFRHAMIHLMDCPHGNWWFFVWHRPYVGYLEQIVRIYGEDDSFAMPYWDWTADPFVADTFMTTSTYQDNALDPTSSHYPEWPEFEDRYRDAIAAVWSGLTPDQLAQENLRGFPDFDTFWNRGVQPNYTDLRANGRSKTPSDPDLTGRAADAVEEEVILAGLRPEQFTTVVSDNDAQLGFNSPESQNHHQGVGSAIIEGQPHNQVHNNLGSPAGGWMPSLLSSVDPIFFMHHCNVDRLWDVWTTKERDDGRTALPTDAEAPRFNPEPFLFYIDAEKQTAPSTAGASMEVEPWGYSYTPGTGAAPAAPLIAMSDAAPRVNAKSNATFELNAGEATSIAVPESFAAAAAKADTRQIAHVTFTPPMMLQGLSFDIFISPKGQAPEISANSPDLAGTFEFFGMVHSHDADFTAAIDITDALDRLHESGALAADGEVDVTVVAAQADGAPKMLMDDMPVEGTLKSVTFETI